MISRINSQKNNNNKNKRDRNEFSVDCVIQLYTKKKKKNLYTFNEYHDLIDALPYIDTFSDDLREKMKELISSEMVSMKSRDYLAPLVVPPTPLVDIVFQKLEKSTEEDVSMDINKYKEFQYNWQIDMYNICHQNERKLHSKDDLYVLDTQPEEHKDNISGWNELIDKAKTKVEHSNIYLVNLELALENVKPIWNGRIELFQKYQSLLKCDECKIESDISTINKRRKLNQITESNYLRVLTGEYKTLVKKNDELFAVIKNLYKEYEALSNQFE